MRTQYKLHFLQPAVTMPNRCHFNFVDGALVEIIGSIACQYQVEFIDAFTNTLVQKAEIRNNQSIKTDRQYFTPWIIKVFRQKDRQLLFSHQFNPYKQRVHIAIESKSLGDTLAWFQSLEDFQLAHDCELICSTYMNELFREQYPDIQFVEPDETVEQLYAKFRIDWFYTAEGEIDLHKNVANVQRQTLGATATDILGLPYYPRRPRLQFLNDLDRPIEGKFVCIAIHANNQAKYWNNPDGWEELVNYLQSRRYEVVLLSQAGLEFMGNQAPEGIRLAPASNLTQMMNYLQHASLFIGIDNGLTWLSWAVGCKTSLISGFSYPFTEVEDLIRISPAAKHCSGCFNRYRVDADDWHWCPDHQHTKRQYECSRSISAKTVIDAIANHLP